jgi:hypothetical protein
MDVQLTQISCRHYNKVTGKQWSSPQAQDLEEHGAITVYILVIFYVIYLLAYS